MLDETFAESIVHSPPSLAARVRGFTDHKVLGIRLRPFSFWHAFNLELIRSPLVGGKGLFDFTSIYNASRCCQLRWPHIISHELVSPVGRLKTRLHAKLYLKRFIKDEVWRLMQINAMTAYVADYFACIPEPVEEEDSKPLRIPWYLYYVCALMEYDRTRGRAPTVGEAWNSEVAASRWWLLGVMQAKGNHVDIVSPEDRVQLREQQELGIQFMR